MSITIRGTWPEDDWAEQGGNHDRAVEQTEGAIYRAIEAAHQRVTAGDRQGLALAEELRESLQAVQRPTVTLEDALAMALQAFEDTGATDLDHEGWQYYDGLQEGVRDHSLYHQARPGECGQSCPAYTSYALETGEGAAQREDGR